MKNLKIGDTVKIKSIEWYNDNKDKEGDIETSTDLFVSCMSEYCGKEARIVSLDYDCGFRINIDDGEWSWDEDMIEE